MAEQKLYWYRVRSSSYSTAGRVAKTYTTGQVFSSTSDSLCEVFRNKFDKVEGPDPAPPAPPESVKVDTPTPTPPTPTPSTPTPPSPPNPPAPVPTPTPTPTTVDVDVSAEFKEAGDAGLKVIQLAAGGFNVSDSGVVLNTEPLSREKVEAFIAEYVK